MSGFSGFTFGQGIHPYILVSHVIWLYIHISNENPEFTSGRGIRCIFTSAMGIHSIPFSDGNLVLIHGPDVNQCLIHIEHVNPIKNQIYLRILNLGLLFLTKVDILWYLCFELKRKRCELSLNIQFAFICKDGNWKSSVLGFNICNSLGN